MKTIVYASKLSSIENLKVKIIDMILGITVYQLTNVFSVNCKIVLHFVLLMIENMSKIIIQNFIKTLKNIDFLLSNSFHRLFLSQVQKKL